MPIKAETAQKDAENIKAFREKKQSQKKAEAPQQQGFLAHRPKSKRIAIVGYAPSSKDLAPYKDKSWEIWGVNELYRLVPRIDVLFEMHDYKLLNTKIRDPKHLEWLQKAKIPIYMLEKHKDIPQSIRYPIEAVVSKYGRYFTNSMSYMIVLAMELGAEEIGLWGVDMATQEEYQRQRPSVEYFIGIAVGRGIKVVIPPQCDLVKTFWLYGYDNEQQTLMWDRFKARKKELNDRIAQFQAQAEKAIAGLNQMAGAKDDLEYIWRTWDNLYDWAGDPHRKPKE